MAYDVVLDPAVVARIDEIVGYLADELGSPAAAQTFLEGLDELLDLLESLPLSYPPSNDDTLAARGYRRALVGNYVVLFRVGELDGNLGVVWVTNLFHGSQDYPRLV